MPCWGIEPGILVGVLHDDDLVQRGDQRPVADGRGVQGDAAAGHQPGAALDELLLPVQQRHHDCGHAQHRARQLQNRI